jgi:mannose-6-phosphate isomerase-like protein (cupin superfamily)
MTFTSAGADSSRILDHDGFPGRWEILETADETAGERLKTRMQLDEEGELPPHLHPTAEESYEVVAGELDVQIDGEWFTVEAGEKVTIPPDTEHAFRNTGHAEVINVHQPAMQFEKFFRGFHRLKTERGVPMPPDGLKSSILLAMLVVEHEDEQRVVSPPHWVFKVLSRIGHLLGYRLPD